MNESSELTLDQEFSLKIFADQVKRMSREQAQELLIEQNRLMMIQKSTYQNLLRHKWKLNFDFASP